jgi:hypothetical protein
MGSTHFSAGPFMKVETRTTLSADLILSPSI